MAKQEQPKEDIRILTGGRGKETEIKAHIDSPTWMVDKAWDRVKEVAKASLDSYLEYTASRGLPHSYLLGLDILITGTADRSGKKILDIRPTLLEGPCCNSYPACPNHFADRVYKQMKAAGFNPDDYVEYPVHPTKVLERIAEAFKAIWHSRGRKGMPVVGVFTRSYVESEEETAHLEAMAAFQAAGMRVYRITPDEHPYVKEGKIWVENMPMDLCYRRIERVHVPMFYGWDIAMEIIYGTPNTIWVNPWEIDSLRSKTIEETCFREWEAKGGTPVSRPITLVGKEISMESVGELMATGGYAFKRWDSTGGKGVFLHVNHDLVKKLYDKLYSKYDGRHMLLIETKEIKKYIKEFEDFREDASIQQMRLIDAKVTSHDDTKLVYDMRINCLYNEINDEWEFISGISRTVPCGTKITNGNSLLTNVSSGAEMSPLIMGKTKNAKAHKVMAFGPLLTAMLNGKTETTL